MWGRLAGSKLDSVGGRGQLRGLGPIVGELVVEVPARALVLLGSWRCEGPQAAISSQVELAGQGEALRSCLLSSWFIFACF